MIAGVIIGAGRGGRERGMRQRGMVHESGGSLAARAQAMLSREVWRGAKTLCIVNEKG